jgi:hypothetical protein
MSYKEHVLKYRKLNKEHGIKWGEKDLPEGWTKESLRKEVLRDYEENRHLNFIDLHWWDGHTVFLRVAGKSLSEKVCMLKRACMDYIFDSVEFSGDFPEE